MWLKATVFSALQQNVFGYLKLVASLKFFNRRNVYQRQRYDRENPTDRPDEVKKREVFVKREDEIYPDEPYSAHKYKC